MKRKNLKMILCTGLCVMAMAFAACGGGDGNMNADGNENPSGTESENKNSDGESKTPVASKEDIEEMEKGEKVENPVAAPDDSAKTDTSTNGPKSEEKTDGPDAPPADAAPSDGPTANKGSDSSEKADGPGSERAGTMEDYAASEMIQSQIESVNSDEMKLTVTGEGNKLIFTFKYLKVEKDDSMAEKLKEAMAEQEDTFKLQANVLKQSVNVDDPVVVITYVDKNDDVIYSQEYTAD